MPLTYKDFKFISMGEDKFYLEARRINHTICLESCLNGYDVAIYRQKRGQAVPELVSEKTCTNLKPEEIIGKRGPLAIEIANQKIKELRI